MKKTSAKGIVIIGILLIGLVAYYAYLSNRNRELLQGDSQMTPVQKVLAKDLANQYPPTPKEVLKYYGELQKCIYNETLAEGELEQLLHKQRDLYDQELLDNNAWEAQLAGAQKEVEEFRAAKRRITSVAVGSAASVEYYSVDGFDLARIRCAFNIKQGVMNSPLNQVFLLRRDSGGLWRILGWELASNLEESTEAAE